MTTIKLKNGSGAPLAGDLVQGEPALDLTNKRLYTEDSGGTVIEVGTNPTSLTTGTFTSTGIDDNAASTAITIDGSQNVSIGGRLQIGNNIPVWSGYWGGALFLKGDNSTPDRYAQLAIVNNLGNIVHQGLILNNDGNVGIGTSSPSTKLEISNGAITAGNSGTVLVGRNSSSFPDPGAGYFSLETNNTDGNNGGITIKTLASDTLTERMRIDSSGNVGIGTTSPSSLLHIAKTLAGSDTSGINIQNVGIFTWGLGIDNAVSNSSLLVQSGGIGGTTRLAIDSNGKVGIGEDTPAQKLHLRTSGVNTGARLQVAGGSGRSYDILSTTDGSLTITDANASSERMRIDSSGVVSIGDTGSGSASRLYVLGASTNSNIGVARFNTTGDDESSSCIAVVKNSGSTSTSNVFIRFGIANYNSGCGQINANGVSQAAFGSFSDRRLKENITDLPNQLASITALRPVEFDYIESEGGGHQIGFIAQEVEEIYPDLVGERHDGMKTLTGINKMEARLIKAIQEQNELINDLRARVAQLEGAN